MVDLNPTPTAKYSSMNRVRGIARITPSRLADLRIRRCADA